MTAEILKCGKETLLPHLHHLLIQCWNEGTVPQDMRDSNIVTIYKNKGDRSDCNNYRGISMLSIVEKSSRGCKFLLIKSTQRSNVASILKDLQWR